MKTALFIILCMGVAIALRTIIPYEQVFTEHYIKFSGIDAYNFMREVDSMAPAFSSRWTELSPFFQWLLSGTAWLAGGGHPTQAVIDTVAAYFPPALAALMVLPVYFIGRAIGGNITGVIASVLIAILPGEYFGRSKLGFTDYHILESLLVACVALFLVLAVKSRRLAFLYGLVSGIFLLLYFFTWSAAYWLVAILAVFFIAQYVQNYRLKRSSVHLSYTGVAVFLPLILGFSRFTYLHERVLVIMLILLPAALLVLQIYAKKRKLSLRAFSGIISGSLLLLFALVCLIAPGVLSIFINYFYFMNPLTTSAMTTLELSPLFLNQGAFDFMPAWQNFTLLLFIMPVALWVIYCTLKKESTPPLVFLGIWSLIALLSTLLCRRFAYYLAVNAALLGGYFIMRLWSYMRIRRSIWKMAFLAVTAIALVAPNLYYAQVAAGYSNFIPTDAWLDSCKWIEANTPIDARALSWWDFGYLITREAKRATDVTPGQSQEGNSRAASLLLAQNTDEAMPNLGKQDYLVIDYTTVLSKLWAIAQWNGKKESDYSDIYYARIKGNLIPVRIFYPEYYQSYAVRLYGFDGKAFTPTSSAVIRYHFDVDRLIRVLDEVKVYNTYEEASQNTNSINTRIAGINPFDSPVPIEAVKEYRLVHESEQRLVNKEKGIDIAEVKVFQEVNGKRE